MEATSDSREPPSGYVLRELSQRSIASSPDTESIEALLIARLGKSNPRVKAKSLRCIRHLCINGRRELAHRFQGQHSVIRDCSNYTGVHDPLYGDELNQQVRDAAKETLNALFSSREATTQPSIPNTAYSGQGFSSGSGTYQMRSMPAVSSHPYDPNAPKQPTFLDKVKTASKTIGAVFANPSGSPVNFNQYPAQRAYESPAPIQHIASQPVEPSHLISQTRVRRKKGHVGGVWASDGYTSPPPSLNSRDEVAAVKRGNNAFYNGPVTSYDPAKVSHKPQTLPSCRNPGVERYMVEELCGSVGVSSKPSIEALDEFDNCFSNLNMSVLATQLTSKLTIGDNKWQVHKKALLVLRHVFELDEDDEMLGYFSDNPECLFALAEQSQVKSVSKLASEILYQCGHDVPASSPQHSTSASVPPETFSSKQPQLEPSDDDIDLFSSMALGSDSKSDQPAPTVRAPIASSFSFLNPGPTSSAAAVDSFPSTRVSDDMFDLLEFSRVPVQQDLPDIVVVSSDIPSISPAPTQRVSYSGDPFASVLHNSVVRGTSSTSSSTPNRSDGFAFVGDILKKH